MTGGWTEHCSPGKICQKFRRVPDGTFFFSAKSGLLTGSPQSSYKLGRGDEQIGWTNCRGGQTCRFQMDHSADFSADHRFAKLSKNGVPLVIQCYPVAWNLIFPMNSPGWFQIYCIFNHSWDDDTAAVLRYSHILRCLAQPPSGIAPISIAWSPD